MKTLVVKQPSFIKHRVKYLIVFILITGVIFVFKNISFGNDFTRSKVKNYIDELYSFNPSNIEHTTDSVTAPPRILFPAKPKPFEAGRFKVSFIKGNNKKAIIFQTEELVGHISEVIPGKTNIGGYVQLLDDPTNEYGPGPKLNSEELDYFIQTIYRKFTNPLDDEEANLLNRVKDYALAIMFGKKEGINEYHNNQIKMLKSIGK